MSLSFAAAATGAAAAGAVATAGAGAAEDVEVEAPVAEFVVTVATVPGAEVPVWFVGGVRAVEACEESDCDMELMCGIASGFSGTLERILSTELAG